MTETDCTYFFTWETKYACVGENEALPCMVSDQKKRYDLARLIRHSGMVVSDYPNQQDHSLSSRSISGWLMTRYRWLPNTKQIHNCRITLNGSVYSVYFDE